MKHLDDREFAALAGGEEHAGAAAHLAACDLCRAEVERLHGFAAKFRETLIAAAERSSPRLRVFPPPPHHWRALAAALAMLLVVSLALLHYSPPQRSTAAALSAQKDAADDLLLLEVDSDISSAGPEALAPAALIVQARNKQAERYEKETR